MNLLHIY